MKLRILLFMVMTLIITSSQAQKSGKASKPITGYAITAAEKGGRGWKEVRLVDMGTGAEVKNIYDSKKEIEPLNARTGKAIVKKDMANSKTSTSTYTYTTKVRTTSNALTERKVVNLDEVLDNANGNSQRTHTRVVVVRRPMMVHSDHPFSTNSAAMAYDKKHHRLYYTPMSINQLRYIDLKSGNVYFFEDEPFGVVKSGGDVANQITRMVIASDGNGYALTNDGNHLIRFTTGKKPTITDLGELADDGANTKFSIHSSSGYGGDMVADAKGNLYLVTANRNVFKISLDTKLATHLGTIKNLPRGFSTNAAMVEGGSKVIVASSESTLGYFRFDLNTLEAEKMSGEGDVFNASDLANGILAFDKKRKDRKDEKEEIASEDKAPVIPETARTEQTDLANGKPGISVYPNPVTDGYVRLNFSEQPAGKYQVQLLDISGKLISTKEVNLNGGSQIEEFRFPELSVRGNYLIRVTNEANRVNVTNKIVVQ
jgi:hypothetical protein